MKVFALITCILFSLSANALDKSFRIGGFAQVGYLNIDTSDNVLGDYGGTSLSVGPTAYFSLAPRWTLFTSLYANLISVKSDFALVQDGSSIGDFAQFEVDSTYAGLDVGGIFHLSRGFGFLLNYSLLVKAGGFKCEDTTLKFDADAENFEAALCNQIKNDQKSIAHTLTGGVHFRLNPWLYLQPFIRVSIGDYGKNYLKSASSTGLNVVFAF